MPRDSFASSNALFPRKTVYDIAGVHLGARDLFAAFLRVGLPDASRLDWLLRLTSACWLLLVTSRQAWGAKAFERSREKRRNLIGVAPLDVAPMQHVYGLAVTE